MYLGGVFLLPHRLSWASWSSARPRSRCGEWASPWPSGPPGAAESLSPAGPPGRRGPQRGVVCWDVLYSNAGSGWHTLPCSTSVMSQRHVACVGLLCYCCPVCLRHISSWCEMVVWITLSLIASCSTFYVMHCLSITYLLWHRLPFSYPIWVCEEPLLTINMKDEQLFIND